MPGLKKRFLGALIRVTTGNAALNISGLIVVMIAARHISVHDLGKYVILELVTDIIEVIGGMGIRLSLIKHVVEYDTIREKQEAIVTCSLFIISSYLFLALTAYGADLHFHFLPSGLTVLLFLFYSLSKNFFQYINSSVLQGLQNFSSLSKSYILHSISKIFFVVLFIVILKKNLNFFILAIGISFLLPSLYSLCKAIKQIGIRFQLNFKRFTDIFVFGIPLYLNSLISLASSKGYTLLVAFFLTPEAVAYYNIATRIPNVIAAFQNVYNTVFFPTIVECLKEQTQKAVKLLNASISGSFVLLIPGVLIFYFLRDEITIMLFTEKYLVSAYAAFLLILRSLFTFTAPMLGSALVAVGNNRAPLYVNVPTVVLTFVLSALFISTYGFMTVVYVSLAGSIFSYLLNYLFIWRSKIRINLTLSVLLIILSIGAALVRFQIPHELFLVVFISALVFVFFANLKFMVRVFRDPNHLD